MAGRRKSKKIRFPMIANTRMTLAYLDTEKRSLSKLVHLPSSGDNSYPGMVWHDGILWVSYYSSHRQAQTRIHLAKVWLRAR